MKDLKKFRVIVMFYNGERTHSALHIGDGLFLSKAGHAPSYFVSSFDELKKVYKCDIVKTIDLDSQCDFCHVSKPVKRLFFCLSCNRATYCDRTCQLNDWSTHRPECKNLIDEKKKALMEEAIVRDYVKMFGHRTLLTVK